MRTFFGAFLILALTGCARYSFDINDNQVYRPPSLYTTYAMTDPALQNCIDQAIKDQGITAPADLIDLNCSHAGITDMDKISTFSRIERLSLKGNDITDIEELLQLTHLRVLDLSDTATSDCQTLKQLSELVTDSFLHTSICPL